MQNTKRAAMISALPDSAAQDGIRAYILHKGLEGNLEDGAKAFDELWQCEGHEASWPDLTPPPKTGPLKS